MSPILIAIVGAVINSKVDQIYQERETRIKEVQTVEQLLDDLTKDNIKSQQIAIVTIAALGNKSLAINLATLNPGQGSILALRKIVLYSHAKQNSLEAVEALLTIGRNYNFSNKTYENNEYTDDVVAALQGMSTEKLDPQVSDKVQQALKEFTAIIESPKPTSSPKPTLSLEINTKWAIVIGSDRTLNAAEHEVRIAQKTNIWEKTLKKGQKIVIFDRRGWYRTVIVNFKTNEDAKQQLTAIKKQIRESSYPVNLDSWCPNYKFSDQAQTKSFKCD